MRGRASVRAPGTCARPLMRPPVGAAETRALDVRPGTEARPEVPPDDDVVADM
ncbi:hypothetical protein Asi02nite_05900 [Asanoa siamensis]|uniref:Uncharacterized protein n=1 Tax=Asanoa siamensis TaxID=926357 RepID=A0ABQ4CIE0_9ACTN|nr:hypothetical protein Asi02nite_05900 [Asanoa siamensis]